PKTVTSVSKSDWTVMRLSRCARDSCREWGLASGYRIARGLYRGLRSRAGRRDSGAPQNRDPSAAGPSSADFVLVAGLASLARDTEDLTTQIPRQYVCVVAQVAELVDALVSGTSAERRGGSSPLLGTRTFYPYRTHRFVRGSVPVWSAPGCAMARSSEPKCG